jgi:hypothetical protein
MTLSGNKDARNDTFISATHGISVIMGKGISRRADEGSATGLPSVSSGQP